ncbi:MAG: hypothetical protein ACI4F1_00250 [Bariatricus sp.]
MNYSIIGGADGPNSVFVAGQIGWSWINIFGFILVVLMLLPNILYAFRFRGQENKVTNKWIILVEQIGRYASMFLMVFNIGIAEFGFQSVVAFLVYGIGNLLLLVTYWIIWILYFKEQKLWKSMALAILPTCMFLLSGITLRHVLLVVSAVVFGIGHIYITYQNAKE